MDVNVIKILSDYGASTVSKIQANLSKTKTTATGKTAKSLRYEIKENGDKVILSIFGKAYIGVVETGRKATPDKKPSKEFVENIKEWVKAKNVKGSPYAIAMSINLHGSKLKQKGGRQDIISNVINKSLTDEIAKSILSVYSNILVTNIRQIYGNSN
jgi:hypothetical protein